MNTKIFDYILSVAEMKSISKAADLHLLSQPALSQHIRKIESRYEIILFEKSRTGLVPTKEGELFLTTIRRMRQTEEETLQQIQALKQPPAKEVRIFTDNHLRNRIVDHVWPVFSKKHPGAKLSLVSGNTNTGLQLLENGFIDTALIPVNTPLPPFLDEILAREEEMLLIVPESAGNLLVNVSEPSGPQLSDLLSDFPFLIACNDTLYEKMQLEALQLCGISVSRTESVRQFRTIAKRVQEGTAFSFIPLSLARELGLKGFLPTRPYSFRIVMAFRRKDGLKDYQKELLSCFVEAIE